MRLTRFNPETGQYEYIEKAKTLDEFKAQRKAAIQRLGELEDKGDLEDAVAVVRCKDCKYWDRENSEKHSRSTEDDTLAEFAECFRWSNWSVCRILRDDNYCSCGERCENEGRK